MVFQKAPATVWSHRSPTVARTGAQPSEPARSVKDQAGRLSYAVPPAGSARAARVMAAMRAWWTRARCAVTAVLQPIRQRDAVSRTTAVYRGPRRVVKGRTSTVQRRPGVRAPSRAAADAGARHERLHGGVADVDAVAVDESLRHPAVAVSGAGRLVDVEDQ